MKSRLMHKFINMETISGSIEIWYLEAIIDCETDVKSC